MRPKIELSMTQGQGIKVPCFQVLKLINNLFEFKLKEYMYKE